MTWHHGDQPGSLKMVDRKITTPTIRYTTLTEPVDVVNGVVEQSAEPEIIA